MDLPFTPLTPGGPQSPFVVPKTTKSRMINKNIPSYERVCLCVTSYTLYLLYLQLILECHLCLFPPEVLVDRELQQNQEHLNKHRDTSLEKTINQWYEFFMFYRICILGVGYM